MENKQQVDNSRTILAFVLIGVGILWTLNQIGIHFRFLHVSWENLFFPFRPILHRLSYIIFSWQMLLIIIGLVLLAGRRSTGIVLIIIGGVFLLPRLFFVPHISASFILPVILIGIGVALIARL